MHPRKLGSKLFYGCVSAIRTYLQLVVFYRFLALLSFTRQQLNNSLIHLFNGALDECLLRLCQTIVGKQLLVNLSNALRPVNRFKY